MLLLLFDYCRKPQYFMLFIFSIERLAMDHSGGCCLVTRSKVLVIVQPLLSSEYGFLDFTIPKKPSLKKLTIYHQLCFLYQYLGEY